MVSLRREIIPTTIMQNLKYGAQESIDPRVEVMAMKKNLLARTQSTQAAQQSTKPPSIDVATTQAMQSGANPLSLAMAKKQLGNQEYIGYCEQFVEQTTGSGWKGTSALNAWNNQAEQGKAVSGLQGIKPGDAVYFNDSSQPFGHVGLYSGNDQFISATDNGIQQNDLGKWQESTGQQVLGYVPQGGTNVSN
jgi:NlpC/P60 family